MSERSKPGSSHSTGDQPPPPDAVRETGQETEIARNLREKIQAAYEYIEKYFGSRQNSEQNPSAKTTIDLESGSVEARYKPGTFDHFIEDSEDAKNGGHETSMLAYHHKDHTEALVRRVKEMVAAINQLEDETLHIDDEMSAVLEYAAAMHDIIQNTFIFDDGVKSLRDYPPYSRVTGVTPPDTEHNEKRSAASALQEVKEL